jgi:hypothetical protein
VLNADGTVRRAGFFNDSKPLAERLGFTSRVAKRLNKSAIWQVLSTRDSRITEDDVRLYLALVRRSEELLTAQYPALRFHVILWPNAGASNTAQQRSTYHELQDGFRRMGIPVALAEDILRGYRAHPEMFQLSPVDTHPNALANRLLAQYVLRKIAQ